MANDCSRTGQAGLSCYDYLAGGSGYDKLHAFVNGELGRQLNINFNRLTQRLEALEGVTYYKVVGTDTISGGTADLTLEGDVSADFSSSDVIYLYDRLGVLLDSFVVSNVGVSGGNTVLEHVTGGINGLTTTDGGYTVVLRDPSLGNLSASSFSSVSEMGDEAMRKTVITCDELPINMSDEAGVGQYGGTKIYDFPAGLVVVHGGVVQGSFEGESGGSWIATFNGDVSLGTSAPTDHATGLVAANTARFVPSTALTTAVAGVAAASAVTAASPYTESGAQWVDGTGPAVDLYLNLLVDDNAAHADGDDMLFTGTVTFLWSYVNKTP